MRLKKKGQKRGRMNWIEGDYGISVMRPYAVFLIQFENSLHAVKALTRLDENTHTTVLEAMEGNEDLMFHWAVLAKMIPSIEADINIVFNHTWIIFCGILLGNIQTETQETCTEI